MEVRPSPIAGSGLFTRTVIQQGEVVARLGGTVVDNGEVRRRLRERSANASLPYVDTISLDESTNLVLPEGEAIRFGNHSCDPNLWWADALTLVARRDIGLGEELTNDYATSTGLSDFRMPCACGTENCRGVITGEDWRLETLQREYLDHWTPVLLKRLRPNGPP